MGYVEELRALVGHRPIILASAEVIVLDGDGRLLLQKRADNGLWSIPGGMMEPGEAFEDTARREVFEETGLTLGRLALVGVFSGPEFYYRYPNGDEVYNVTTAYACREFTGRLRSDRESLESGFFPIDEPPGEIIFLNRMVLDAYQRKAAARKD